jgi:hypothetical protein
LVGYPEETEEAVRWDKDDEAKHGGAKGEAPEAAEGGEAWLDGHILVSSVGRTQQRPAPDSPQ